MALRHLAFKGISVMGFTKDRVQSQQTDADILNVCTAIARDIKPTHIEPALFLDSNAQFIAAGRTPGARTIENFLQIWADTIHSVGVKVTHRHTFAGIKNNYNFTKLQGSNRYPLGSVASVLSTTAFSDNFNRVTLDSDYSETGGWTVNGSALVSPPPSGWTRLCLTTATYSNFTAQAKIQALNYNTQLAFRTSTSAGYGAQIRLGDGLFRLERWGAANLAQVPKTFTAGAWYQVKVSANGSAIKCKVWLDGTSEPAAWDIEVTDSTYSSGKIGFSSESSGAQFDDLVISSGGDLNSFLGKIWTWMTNSASQIESGDAFNFISEATECSSAMCIFNDATSWVAPPQGANYAAFAIDLKTIIEERMSALGKTTGPMFPPGENWSEIASGYIPNSLFDAWNAVSHDHYGAASATPVQDTDTEQNNVSLATALATGDVYTTPTSIIETNANKQFFSVSNTGHQLWVSVYIVNKGTGDWTLTWHDYSNNPVQQLNEKTQALTPLSSYNTVKIPNSMLVNNSWNTFQLSWDKPDFRGGNASDPSNTNNYHVHITSTVADGTILVVPGAAGNLDRSYMISVRSQSTARAMELDMRRTYNAKGKPIYHLEWSDFWSGGGSFGLNLNSSFRIRDISEFFRVFDRLADEGIYAGFQWWRAAVGVPEACLTQNADGTYKTNAIGKLISAHFNGNGFVRYPILDSTGNDSNF